LLGVLLLRLGVLLFWFGLLFLVGLLFALLFLLRVAKSSGSEKHKQQKCSSDNSKSFHKRASHFSLSVATLIDCLVLTSSGKDDPAAVAELWPGLLLIYGCEGAWQHGRRGGPSLAKCRRHCRRAYQPEQRNKRAAGDDRLKLLEIPSPGPPGPDSLCERLEQVGVRIEVVEKTDRGEAVNMSAGDGRCKRPGG